MSVLIATDALNSGLSMAGSRGVVSSSPGVSTTYLGALDEYTVAFAVSGMGPIKYFTISGTVNTLNGNLFITDINYYDVNVQIAISWSDCNLFANIYDDFSRGMAFSILNGNDLISGNSFSDTIKSGFGADTIYGKRGNDALFGEGGSDVIYGNHGLDTLSGGSGNDILYGGQNSGPLSGGTGAAGDGVMKQRFGVEFLNGNSGNDVIYGNYGRDILKGGSGNDNLFGGQDTDVLYGGTGADTLNGNRGNDVLVGGGGADVFVLKGNGSDVVVDFDGAEGDRIDAITPSAVQIHTSDLGNVVLVSQSHLGGVPIELSGVSASLFTSDWII